MSTPGAVLPRVSAGRLIRRRGREAASLFSIDVWLLIGLVAVATAVRVLTIDNQSFWADEALTAYEAGLTLGSMIHTVATVETSPPLYFLIAWAWAHAFGSGEVALRSISAVAGIALVPIGYLAARELFSRRAGVLAAALLAVNPFAVWYSQEARPYMLLAALSGASFVCFARARRKPSPRHLACWTVWSALALMTHFFAGFLVAPEALYLLWRNRTKAVATAVAVVAVTQLAMLPFAAADRSHGLSWIAAIPLRNRISNTFTEWGASQLYYRATIEQGLVGGAIVVAVVSALLLGRRYLASARSVAGEQDRHASGVGADCDCGGVSVTVWVAGFALLVPVGLVFVGFDYFYSRNLISALVPVAVLLAAACVAGRPRVLGGALALALLALFSWATVVVQTSVSLQRPNWRAVARALGPATGARAVIAAGGTKAQALKIYLPRVDWTQGYTVPVDIQEVDVVGTTKPTALLPLPPAAQQTPAHELRSTPKGSAVPRLSAPAGTRLLSRVRVDGWVVARFELTRPLRTNINQLSAIARRFFRRTPRSLLVFTQPADRQSAQARAPTLEKPRA